MRIYSGGIEKKVEQAVRAPVPITKNGQGVERKTRYSAWRCRRSVGTEHVLCGIASGQRSNRQPHCWARRTT